MTTNNTHVRLIDNFGECTSRVRMDACVPNNNIMRRLKTNFPRPLTRVDLTAENHNNNNNDFRLKSLLATGQNICHLEEGKLNFYIVMR